ncbi:hypothetical protein [Georgenia ruanii]|uniref:hypothetical protein n=1 Tax=Georgenia ruanii TaxID=348442 RepID=UPI001264D3CC|nr:hypothetical protein [Georgenia ruanii]
MTEAVRAVIVGLGTHGRGIAGFAADAGVEIVAAVDPVHAGRDLRELVDRRDLSSLVVLPTIEDVAWEAVGADVTIVAAKLDVPDLVELVKTILEHDTDILTIVEDVFDLESFAPSLHAELDAAAVVAGRSVVATGVQDIAWSGLVAQATGMQRNLRSIRLKQHLGVDGYPREFVEWIGVGLSGEAFDAAAEEAGKTPSVFGAILPVLVRRLGLTPVEESREMSPYVIDEPVDSITLERTIRPGDPVGRRDVVTVRTAEGVDLVAELVTSALMGQDDFHAVLDGDPRVEIDHRLVPGSPAVDATTVNRIPDVIAAPPGLISTIDLPAPRFRPRITKESVRAAAALTQAER